MIMYWNNLLFMKYEAEESYRRQKEKKKEMNYKSFDEKNQERQTTKTRLTLIK